MKKYIKPSCDVIELKFNPMMISPSGAKTQKFEDGNTITETSDNGNEESWP